jgi:Uma2 family endonuclease
MVTIPQPLTMLPDREQRIAMTYDEFHALVGETVHAEWANEEAVIFMPPEDRHQALLGFHHLLVAGFAELLDLGIVRIAPLEMRALPTGPAREPDLLFLAREHLDRLTEKGLAGPADLVIEIISPSSVGRDRAEKFYEYQEAGIREYWLIDPRTGKERLDVYFLGDDGKYQPVLPDSDGRHHAQTLPGFWLHPDWLWQQPRPSALAALMQIIPDRLQVRPWATEL